jgi:O-antigen/teichoic acid export membrane protein
MARDTALYIPAKIIEGLIGFLTVSVYSRMFLPGDFGNYNIVLQSLQIVFLIVLGWLYHSVYRYVNDYYKQNNLELFYSTVFRAWLLITAIAFAASLSLYMIFISITKTPSSKIMLAGIFAFTTYSASFMLLSILAALRKVRLNLVLSVFSVSAKLIMTSIFVLVLKTGIEGALISMIVTDFIITITVVLRLRIYRYIRFSLFSTNVLKGFSSFSIPIVGVTVTITLLNVSDRYMIKFLLSDEANGIYTANYSIASAALGIFIAGIMRGIYPMVLKVWEGNNRKLAEELISHGVRYFLLVTVPAALGLSVLSGHISHILDPAYYSGSSVIIWVSLGMVFFGLSEYNNKAWELSSKTRPMFINGIICCLINIILNFIFIPIYGFIAAAVTTTFSYLVYFVLSYVKSRRLMKLQGIHSKSSNKLGEFYIRCNLLIYNT